MVSVSDSGMTKVCGKIALRHAHVRELLRHRPQRGELQAQGLRSSKAMSGLVELAHDAASSALSPPKSPRAGAAEMLARRVLATAFERCIVRKRVQEGTGCAGRCRLESCSSCRAQPP
jgi:hypothetical protein